jgi:hypothetical protein
MEQGWPIAYAASHCLLLQHFSKLFHQAVWPCSIVWSFELVDVHQIEHSLDRDTMHLCPVASLQRYRLWTPIEPVLETLSLLIEPTLGEARSVGRYFQCFEVPHHLSAQPQAHRLSQASPAGPDAG